MIGRKTAISRRDLILRSLFLDFIEAPFMDFLLISTE
ncbi:hypothetical protein LSS_12012 [Leptospira santarosai serovar Shermani str. LT 821]|uniref:Uncharacterized protein n=1 Tax=Leptospira santarosai serovar Shermani str. LT 821 TaxID=758847 RepID=K8Y9U0_9LEPT|nr:Uncharacterized protein XB15_00991 [Leptospira santarosai]EKT86430.1 hypothetical protein LSS_12012 [Leptospira santarosai serovar Shermani str. LT 821]